jgi:hypothetical protein
MLTGESDLDSTTILGDTVNDCALGMSTLDIVIVGEVIASELAALLATDLGNVVGGDFSIRENDLGLAKVGELIV